MNIFSAKIKKVERQKPLYRSKKIVIYQFILGT